MSTDPREREDIALVQANADDAANVADVVHRARTAAYPQMPPSVHTRDELDAWVAQTLAGPRETWVARAGDSVVGFLLLDPSWLDSLYVAPEHQGTGIGTALLDLAKTLRPDGFSLWVFESNTSARRFYAARGLVEVRRTDGDDNEEGLPDIEMAWLGLDPLAALRRRIDRVDAALADLLDLRTVLSGHIQTLKPVPGHAGRDLSREAQIVAGMAERTPHLTPEALAAIMREVIAAGLDANRPPEEDR